jgi:hypothetical protein
MDENHTSAPTSTMNSRKWIGQLVAAVILAEGIWGFLASLTGNLLVPLLARVMNGDPGAPTYLGKGEVNVPALFNSFLALCFSGIVFLLLYGWSLRKPAPSRAKMMRAPKVSQLNVGPPSIIASPPKAVSAPTKDVVNPPETSAAPLIPPVPTPQHSKPTPPPVAGPTKPAKPQPPKEVYYNLVGEPINPTEEK